MVEVKVLLVVIIFQNIVIGLQLVQLDDEFADWRGEVRGILSKWNRDDD